MDADENPGIPPIARRDQGILPPYVEGVLFMICGLIIGAGMTVYIMDNTIRDLLTQPDQLPERLLRQMDRRLDLTEAQRLQAESIVAEHFVTFDELRRQVQPEIQATLDSLRDDVAEILDPDQRETWRANFERIRDKWQPGPLILTPAARTATPPPATPLTAR